MPVILRTLKPLVHTCPSRLASQASLALSLFRGGRFADHNATLTFTSDRHVALLNGRYALRLYATDVLSFPLHQNQRDDESVSSLMEKLENASYLDLETGEMKQNGKEKVQEVLEEVQKDLGNVFLAEGVCKRMARRRGMRVEDYVMLASVHGLAHLVGYLHGRNESYERMKSAEKEVMKALIGEMRGRGELEKGDRFVPLSYLP